MVTRVCAMMRPTSSEIRVPSSGVSRELPAVDRDPVHAPGFAGVVVQGVVPGRAVVPERDAPPLPAEPARVLRARPDAVQILQEGLGLLDGLAIDV